MANKILIIDFDDSFTMNIASLFLESGFESDVIKWSKLNAIDFANYQVLVWGPGPGKPEDYKSIFAKVKELLEDKNIFHFGICLGHQILGVIRGYELKNAKIIRHGINQKIELSEHFKSLLDLKYIEVQFYNSLELTDVNSGNDETQLLDGSCLIISNSQLLTYQFHPESIGSSCPSALLAPVLRILYNGSNDTGYKN